MHSLGASLKEEDTTTLVLLHFRRFLYVKVGERIMKQRYEQLLHE